MDDILAKLDRAQKHLDAVALLEGELRNSPEYGVISEESADGNFVTFRLRLPAPDPSMSLIVGDCVHNARTSLDHLIYALAEAKSTRTRTDEEQRASMFPICLCPSGSFTVFDGQIRRGRLNGIPDRAVAIIKGLQPTDRSDPLWILNELENIDKHRHLTLLAVILTDLDMKTGVSGVTISGGKYRDGDTLLRESVGTPERLAKIRAMKMELQSSIFVTLQDLPAGSLGASVVLQQGLDLIRDKILPALEPFFY